MITAMPARGCSWAVIVLILTPAVTIAGPGAPRLSRGPYLQALLDTSVEVVWLTDGASRGAVVHQSAGGAEESTGEAAPATLHRLKLLDLAPGMTYSYRLLANEEPLHEGAFHFRTSPGPGGGEIRLAVAGDSGNGSARQVAVANVIRDMSPDLFIHTGDLDYLADVDRSIFAPYREILPNAGFYPCRGNHDIHLPWHETFFSPNADPGKLRTYYSFDWGSAHFVALDTNADALGGGEQVPWVVADLESARARGLPWTILFLHEPIYTVGGYANQPLVAPLFLPEIADQFEVDLVLSGHDHNYQRTHPVRDGIAADGWQNPEFTSPAGTIYLITGGGGQTLYPEKTTADHRRHRLFRYAHHAVEIVISPERLSARAITPDGEVIDAFSVRKDLPGPEFRFLRGDANLDGAVDVADAIRILNHLFLGMALECPLQAQVIADVNGSSDVNIADPVYLLGFLFLGGPPPPPPSGACGTLDGADAAWCTRMGCAR